MSSRVRASTHKEDNLEGLVWEQFYGKIIEADQIIANVFAVKFKRKFAKLTRTNLT